MNNKNKVNIFWSQLFPIIKKELRQIKRDFRILILLLIFPAIFLVLLGYALNFDVKHITILFCDQDLSIESRKFIDRFSNTEYFDIVTVFSEEEKIDDYLDRGLVRAAITIPPKFGNKLTNNETVSIQILIDGTDGNTAGTAINYIMLITLDYSQKLIFDLAKRTGINIFQTIDFKPTVWFNPELKTTKFLLPGLIAFIIMIVCTVSTALSIVREKENGTMEQLMVSPLRAFNIILGKTIPYVIFGIIATTLILVFSLILFGITIKGNLLLLFLSILFFIFGALGLGIFISTISDSTQVAFIIATLVSMLPTFLLSGFVFPIKNMPVILQIISYIIPAKYFIVILRSIILKGSGISSYWEQFLFLFLFATIIFTLSTIKFSRGRIK